MGRIDDLCIDNNGLTRLSYLILNTSNSVQLLNPLEKVIFDSFFKCNHLIIKWHFVGKRTKNYFLKVDSLLKFRKCTKLRITASFAPHALKGQKLLAQGSALGYHVRKVVAL